jgi:Flp pilus assembly protein TadD
MLQLGTQFASKKLQANPLGCTFQEAVRGKNLNLQSRRLELIICLFLVVATAGVFWQVQNHDFVNYDDNLYVTENYHVQAGLTWDGIIWALTVPHACNWHPLTWLSHMLDCEIYGLNAGGHHLTSLLFHVVNALLLFLVLKRMSGALWRSAFVGALFALHPLHVESVAWVAERKDVLCTFFWLLTMWAYVLYTERPSPHRYFLVLLAFAFGLMSKPMLVTLPFVLLLLDYWPLGRFQFGYGESHAQKSMNLSYRISLPLHFVREKAPFFALAAISSVVTFLAQQSAGSLTSLDKLPLNVRIANALVSYLSYIGKMLWPQRLVVFYPHPGDMLPMWQAIGAALFLICISVLVVRVVMVRPYLAVGWLWYLGTLVPVIGLVQVGSHGMADRYTYVPLIGLFLMITWGVPDIAKRFRPAMIVLPVLGGALLSALMASTWLQVQHWKNSTALFKHAINVTANNYLAHNNLASALARQGSPQEAISHYFEALAIKPHFAEAHYNLGNALARQGSFDEAMGHYTEALRIKPDYADAHNNLGVALTRQGRGKEAIGHYTEALRIKPNFADAHNNLGVALTRQGRGREATGHYIEALRIKPEYADARRNLERTLHLMGKPAGRSTTVARQ